MFHSKSLPVVPGWLLMWNVYRKFTKSMLGLKKVCPRSAHMCRHLTHSSIFGLNTSSTDSFQLKSLPVVQSRLLMWKFYRKDCRSQTSFNQSSIKTQERRRAETFGEDYFYFSVRLLSSIRHISANDRRGARNINQCIGQSQRGNTHAPSRLQSNQTGCDVTRASTQRPTVRRICVDPTRATFSHRTPSGRHVCSFLPVDSCVCVIGNTHIHRSTDTSPWQRIRPPPPPVWHQRSINAERQFDEPKKKKEIRQTKQKILTCQTLNEAPRRPPSFKVHFQTEMLYKLTIQC